MNTVAAQAMNEDFRVADLALAKVRQTLASAEGTADVLVVARDGAVLASAGARH